MHQTIESVIISLTVIKAVQLAISHHCLTVRDEKVISMIYYDNMTRVDVAKELCLSASRIGQIEARILRVLKRYVR